MRSLYWSFLNLPYLLILELIIMLFFCQVYYAKFPPGMEQRRVLLMYPLLSKLWLNLHHIIFFISIHFHELYQGSPTGFLGSRMWPFWSWGFGILKKYGSGIQDYVYGSDAGFSVTAKWDLHQTCSSRIFITGDTDTCQEEICIILWAQFKIALVLALQLLSLP